MCFILFFLWLHVCVCFCIVICCLTGFGLINDDNDDDDNYKVSNSEFRISNKVIAANCRDCLSKTFEIFFSLSGWLNWQLVCQFFSVQIIHHHYYQQLEKMIAKPTKVPLPRRLDHLRLTASRPSAFDECLRCVRTTLVLGIGDIIVSLSVSVSFSTTSMTGGIRFNCASAASAWYQKASITDIQDSVFFRHYFRQGNYVTPGGVYFFICLFVIKLTQKNCRRTWLKFPGKVKLDLT